MAQNIMIVPATTVAGARTVAFGLSDILINKNVRATVLPSFDLVQLEQLLSTNCNDDLLENIVEQQATAALNHDVIIVSGISLHRPYAAELNFAIATALDAAIIFVATPDDNLPETLRQLAIIANPYRFRYEHKILGYVLNKYNASSTPLVAHIPYLGSIPFRSELAEPVSSYHANVTAGIIAKYLDINWLWPFLNSGATTRVSAPIFRQRLIQAAKQLKRKIVLPEGDEPRTLQAANICAERGIAQCILLGQKTAIQQTAAKINLQLHEQITIIDPTDILEKYVEPLVAIRRSKGLTSEEARKQLADNVMLGTMMLQLGEVDGLVSGAVHTTANTIRPALQLIKTVPEAKIVSSIFFMCLPDQVLVYGDCAINPNPSPEELADIAIQSADSAATFGITPRVAMLSYSTGTSGAGADVDKIKLATELAKKQRPDLVIEGPLQYDAAAVKEVGMLKAPNSLVAGRATVFVMPNLDVGNITYKAVQRTTGIVCIGPMLQGLRKPVNDLSRGCLVEDIVYTIAITAVQSKNS